MTSGAVPRRRESVGVAAVAAVLYLALSSAAPRWGDAVDLARRAVTEPLAPYGRAYPLQSLLVRLADLGFDDPARSGSFVTAICAGVGVGLLHRICRRRLDVGRTAALAAAGAWAVGHTYWSSAVDGEAYVLLGVFAVAAYGAVLASRDGGPGAWAAGALVGLMPLHHRAALFLAPVVLVAPIVLAPAGERRSAALRVLVGLVIGSIPFVALVLIEAGRVPGGLSADLLGGVLVGTPRNADLLVHSERALGASLLYVTRWTCFDFVGPALPIAAWGLLDCFRRRRTVGALLTLLGCAGLVLPLRFDAVGDRYVFLVAAYPAVVLALAVGLQALRWRARVLGWAMGALCVLSPPLVYGGLAWSPTGHDLLPALTDDAARDFLLPVRVADDGSEPFVAAVAARAPDRVYAEWGAAAALAYARDVEGMLADVDVRRRMPSADEISASGRRGVVVALTPIWADERSRLPRTDGRVERLAPALYRLLPAE